MKRKILGNYELYLFIMPAVAYFLIFHYAPLYGIQIAFKDFIGSSGIWGSPWVGLKHFEAFFNSYYAWDLIRNTVTISVYTLVLGFPLPILLALMLNEVRIRWFKKLVQTAAYAPHFISTVVMAGMIYIMVHPEYGVVNTIIKMFGFESIDFLNRPEYFQTLYVLSHIWQHTGWGSVIYFAVLAGIDPEQHEAAVIDGATRLQRIWHVNVPVLIPTAVILFILNAGTIMSVGFEKIYLLQTDLNFEASDVISTYIYEIGVQGARFSYTTAIGFFDSLINLLLLIVVNSIAKRVSSTSLW